MAFILHSSIMKISASENYITFTR